MRRVVMETHARNKSVYSHYYWLATCAVWGLAESEKQWARNWNVLGPGKSRRLWLGEFFLLRETLIFAH